MSEPSDTSEIREPTEDELLAFMHPEIREVYEHPKTSTEQKNFHREMHVELWKGEEKRKRDRERREREHTRKALEMFHQWKEDPTKKNLLPPVDNSIREIKKWYDRMSKPVGGPPFPKSTNEIAAVRGQQQRIKDELKKQREIQEQVKKIRKARGDMDRSAPAPSSDDPLRSGSLHDAISNLGKFMAQISAALSPVRDASNKLELSDAMEPMADSVEGDLQKNVSVKTFVSKAESDAIRSPTMVEFFGTVRRFRGHLEWLRGPLRIWWVVIFVFGLPYGGGLAAMFADQWIIAIALFLGASAVLAVKGIVEAKDRERAVLVLILAALFWAAHIGWVAYTHKQFAEKVRVMAPK